MDVKELKKRSEPKVKVDDTGYTFVGCLVPTEEKEMVEKNQISHTEVIRAAYSELAEKLKKEKK